MSLHELVREFLAWLSGQPRQPEPVKLRIEDEPQPPRRRQRRIDER